MFKKIINVITKFPPFRQIIRRNKLRQHVDEVKIVFETLNEKKGISNIMLDVGAHHGGTLTQFAELGWRIFAFEPDSKNRELLISRTSNFKNVSIDSRAVSDRSGDIVKFYTSEVSTGISGLSSFHNSHVESGQVQTIKLSDFCKENSIKNVDFLKIDTEGFDLMVLKGFDWEANISPKFLVTEFENRKTLNLGYSFKDQIKFLYDKGYYVIISEWNPIVEYGIPHTWLRFIENPDLVTNPNSWGNLIACRKEFASKLHTTIKKLGYKIS